jgi:hypothetical protein
MVYFLYRTTSVPLTADTINVLPTDTTNAFCSSGSCTNDANIVPLLNTILELVICRLNINSNKRFVIYLMKIKAV